MLAVPYPLDVVGTLNQSLHLVVPLVRCAAVVVFLTLNHLLLPLLVLLSLATYAALD
jgi:hypothetical protein